MLKLIPQPQIMDVEENTKMNIGHISLGENLLSQEAIEDFLSFCNMPEGEENIIFESDESLGEEEYSLVIDDEIVIRASSASGQLYALQTLKQIIFQCAGSVPKLKISDKPAYKIRGFMLDVGRYFFPVSDVKKIIKRMVIHKLNVLHFHLTEDQGWRVEMDAYPLLTQIGSERKRTNFNHTPHRGFYTKKDIKEIVDYAHAFGIKVMPEFDIPGHCSL